jgi:aerobic-type carbon monoxide dehydrogenase small subunit (CoxS/CutS family)
MTNEQLLSATEEVFGVDTTKNTKKREYVDARRALVTILRDDFGWTYQKAGSPYNYNHATVIHHSNNNDWLCKTDIEYQRKRENLRVKILELYQKESYWDVSTIKRIFVSLLENFSLMTIERLGEILDSEKQRRLYEGKEL